MGIHLLPLYLVIVWCLHTSTHNLCDRFMGDLPYYYNIIINNLL